MRGLESSYDFHTLRLELRRTLDEGVAAAAVSRTAVRDEALAVLREPAGRDRSRDDEAVRLWFSSPDRWRCESAVHRATDPVVQVVAGLQWWISNPLDPNAKIKSGREDADNRVITEAPPFEALWDLSRLDGSRRRERTGETLYLGRQCSTQVATPTGDPTGDGIWPGATREELVIDEERGVVLRWAAYFEGLPYGVIEVTLIAFDEPLPPELFGPVQ